MRHHINDFIECYVIGGIILALILLCFACSWFSPRIDANSMRQLGYEAKAVNFDCFAKYQGRWLTCTAVAHHSIDVHVDNLPTK
jgi:hypothetical protein